MIIFQVSAHKSNGQIELGQPVYNLDSAHYRNLLSLSLYRAYKEASEQRLSGKDQDALNSAFIKVVTAISAVNDNPSKYNQALNGPEVAKFRQMLQGLNISINTTASEPAKKGGEGFNSYENASHRKDMMQEFVLAVVGAVYGKEPERNGSFQEAMTLDPNSRVSRLVHGNVLEFNFSMANEGKAKRFMEAINSSQDNFACVGSIMSSPYEHITVFLFDTSQWTYDKKTNRLNQK